MTNVIVANLAKSRFYRASPVYQYNYGMILKITGIDLPDAYQVDFSNDVNGTSITQVGNADGVTIPSQLFVPGQAIYCWLREHPTQDSGITTAIAVIPVSPRATITDEEPTPVEQSAIDEAIAALNDAVDKAEDAVEHYPTITGGIWYVWDVDDGEYVSTGISATGPQGERGETGSQGPQGERGETGSQGPRGETGSQGPRGETGATGAAGADGFSPTATVTQTQTGATISITDKQGTTTANISNGQDGAPGQPGMDGTDGVSPTVTVTDITGGHRITITDATGAHSFDVMDGQDGQGAVQDVRVNETSVVTDGVANVPIAATGTYGVIKNSANRGIGINQNGELYTVSASNKDIKNGTSSYVSIVPSNQNVSVFYGLAKAAGDTTQSSSSNAVGTYTDAAKVAIQKMLGVPGYYRQIVDVTLAEAVSYNNSYQIDLSDYPAKEIFLFVNVKAAAATTSIRFELWNSDNLVFFGDNYGGGISTSEKTRLWKFEIAGDYAIINTKEGNSLSNSMGSFLTTLVSGRKHDGIYKVTIRPYNETADIPVGSIIRLFAK